MGSSRLFLILGLLLVLGVPFVMRPPAQVRSGDGEGEPLVVVTPHVAQIRAEFERAFVTWHQRVYKKPARIVWLVPGGTSEIVKQLQAKYNAAIASGEIAKDGSCKPGTIPVDMMMGGGSYDHTRLKQGDQIIDKIPMSVPAGFSKEQLDAWFGENSIGTQNLYDPDQYWIGTALSAFGIVYNKELLRELGRPEPRGFDDLTHSDLAGWVALADPRQSGSITTSFDSVLAHYGWDRGWKILRDMCANTRYFTNSSTLPPIDVGQGEAAAGLAIDFYGRNQAQAVLGPGQSLESSRVGYVDPAGAVYIDADPISILRGGPNPELARRFIEFCLSDEGQALWQFRPRTEADDGRPRNEAGEPMGPERYALRRLPVRRALYGDRFWPYLMDQVRPFDVASKDKPSGWRSSIGIMMGAFAIDSAADQRAAWAALNAARRTQAFPVAILAEMERHFYSWPTQQMPDGTTLVFSAPNFRPIRELWKDPEQQARCRIAYTRHFRESYATVVRLWEENRSAPVAR